MQKPDTFITAARRMIPPRCRACPTSAMVRLPSSRTPSAPPLSCPHVPLPCHLSPECHRLLTEPPSSSLYGSEPDAALLREEHERFTEPEPVPEPITPANAKDRLHRWARPWQECTSTSSAAHCVQHSPKLSCRPWRRARATCKSSLVTHAMIQPLVQRPRSFLYHSSCFHCRVFVAHSREPI